MRAIKQRTVEDIIEGEKIHHEGIIIDGKKYFLDIQNQTHIEGKESLSFDFNDGEYTIKIRKGQIYFERNCSRPNHDHDDSESLQIRVDDNKTGVEKGKILWKSRFPYDGEGYEHYAIPFGGIKVGY